MIIAREYEWFGYLYNNEPLSRELIDEVFSVHKVDNELKKFLLEANHYNAAAYMTFGCGISGDVYAHIIDGFRVLDKTAPYDNGLTFNDVTNIEFETSLKRTAIQMRYVSKIYDIPYRIVGFAAIENKDGHMRISKGWHMTNPCDV